MMNDSISEVLRFVQEHDVKFVRLAFCDLLGVQKNLSVPATELPRIFEYGASFDASVVEGFGNVDRSDLFLMPECSTLSILPWRPSHGRVMRLFCSVKNPDGSDFFGDSRNLLKQAVQRCADLGYFCRIGTECEFYLFRTNADGNPTREPFDHGTYCDIAPLDKGENVRRDICLTLEEMEIQPESSHHERGPGQNEIDFRYSDPLSAADNFMTFKWVVKSIAAQNGLFASFLPKPFLDNSGNGMHINLSLAKGGKNLFKTSGPDHSESSESFIAGILERVPEITAFLNPLTNSYHRFGNYEAPKYVTWSHQNRSQLIRIPASVGEYSRMELRSPDPACNPYLAFALLIHAGLDGIEQKLTLTPPCNQNLYEADAYIREHGIRSLPGQLSEALELAAQSEFVRRVLPEDTLRKYLFCKRREWECYEQSNNRHQFEMDTYFHTV